MFACNGGAVTLHFTACLGVTVFTATAQQEKCCPHSTDLFFCQLSAQGANFPCHCCRPHRKSVAIVVLQDLLSLHEHRGFVMSHGDFLQPPGGVRFSRSASRDKIRVTAEGVLPCREGKTTSKMRTLSKALICHWGFLCCSFPSGMCVCAHVPAYGSVYAIMKLGCCSKCVSCVSTDNC